MNKKSRNFFVWNLVLAGFLFCAAFSAQAFAETPFAVVDVQKILEESDAAKAVEKQLKSHRETLQAEFSKHEDDLRSKEKDLLEKRSSLSQEDFAKEGEKFEEQLLETRKLVQKRKQALEKAINLTRAKLQTEIVKIVSEIAEKEGYQVVFSKKQIVIVEKAIDITDEVMDRINKSIPNLDLDIKE